jgi:hypothetical protein
MNTHTLVRCLSFLLLTGSVAASPLAMAASDSGTLLVGVFGTPCTGGIQTIDGYEPPLSIGSYSPTGLTGGKTVALVIDRITSHPCVVGSISALNVSGFSSNPGSSWLTSITCNGVTNNASAASFSYSNGVASWTWSQRFGLFGKQGTNVSCTIVHS